tara:strand:- start:2274 stop:2459 length:186 start_codon:yes stop_codon:yes gene_type:complete
VAPPAYRTAQILIDSPKNNKAIPQLKNEWFGEAKNIISKARGIGVKLLYLKNVFRIFINNY